MNAGRPKGASEVALAALNRREHSVAELRTRLTEKGFERAEVEATLSEMVDLGTLDDERYARLFSEDKRNLQSWGSERIATELEARGLDQVLIERFCGFEDQGVEVERAKELLADRGGSLGDERERSRALGFLTRKGYPYEVAYAAIRAVASG